MRISALQINPILGDLRGNFEKIVEGLASAQREGAQVALFPELSLTGYLPGDLLLDPELLEAVEEYLHKLIPHTKGLFAAVGTPRRNPTRKEKPLFNSAAIFLDGNLVGFHDKVLLPTYDVFDERRYFEPGGEVKTWDYLGYKIGVTICEDAWQQSGKLSYSSYHRDPIAELKEKRPTLLLNLSGSPFCYGRRSVRLFVFSSVAKKLSAPLLFCNQVGGQDELLFDGQSFFLDEKGELLHLAKGFVEDRLFVDLDKRPRPLNVEEPLTEELYQALLLGVRDYFHKQRFHKAILGLSGGIDSAVVACLAQEALGAPNVFAVSLPSRFSSSGGQSDAELLAKRLKIPFQTLPIEPLFQATLSHLTPHLPLSSLTQENLQPRLRTLLLMAYANEQGALLLNTGNKSELAMGYTTLYGDLAGGLGVLADVTKRRVYELARYINRDQEIIPASILTRLPSAELRENQTDQQTLPPYDELDGVIEDLIEERMTPAECAKRRNLSLEKVEAICHQIHRAEYKRRQAPIGIRVTPRAFTRGRYVPIVQGWR